ncbi:MAG: nucleotidyl transferase AbiEii/AbiGii toxin family protein [Polyangiaceae bacterium]|nr:nucleotidyl transferase AbiEii/AbiGii toxin family protein [Myxococcales bacterium]MCB9588099.1 nucleotidyl transferase AbiEii/AbiGii toxin family protein [Polyangiaceae bacterium]
MTTRRSPRDVIPKTVADALPPGRYWFVIGEQAVRCFAPYRPSNDVDFGVVTARNLTQLLNHLKKHGKAQVLERDEGTVHLRFNGVDVSIFVLRDLEPYVADNALDVTGVLATKTHALLDRGLRRDFFDLYVMLQLHSMGLADCLRALRDVYRTEVNDGLVLRALCYFEDAERGPVLPGEGKDDWTHVKEFFQRAVAALIVPPIKPLAIQARVVDSSPAKPRRKRG